MATNNFDPTQYGATPVKQFNPSDYGATPVGKLQQSSQIQQPMSEKDIAMNAGNWFGGNSDFQKTALNQLANSPVGQFAKNYWNTIQNSTKELGQALTPPSTQQPYVQGLAQAGEKILQGTGAGWNAIWAPLSAGVETAIPTGSLGGGAGEAAAKGATSGAPFGPWGLAMGSVLGLAEHFAANTDFFKKNPQALKDINNALLTFAPMLSGLKNSPTEGATDLLNTPVSEYPQALSQSYTAPLQSLYESITKQKPDQVDKLMEQYYNKGVRPSVVGKNTNYQSERYTDNALKAVKLITENKDNLNILDEYGDATGKLPTNLREFSQGIEQTRKIIFDKYNSLAEQAGEQGATVDLNPISDELSKVANDPTVKDLDPGVAKYAQKLSNTFNKRGSYSTTQAQDAIARLNDSLEAYYKNPSFDNATRASTDAMVANQLRQGLDSAIENSDLQDQAGYQDLKNDYGSLKAIEKDVVHRAIVDARQNNKGIVDFSDILSGGDVVKGVINLNPGTMAQGLAMKAIAAFYKHLNNPNTAIKNLFNVAEKYQTTSPDVVPPVPNEMPSSDIPGQGGASISPDQAAYHMNNGLADYLSKNKSVSNAIRNTDLSDASNFDEMGQIIKDNLTSKQLNTITNNQAGTVEKSIDSFIANAKSQSKGTPQELTIEQSIEQKGGWQSGQRTKFDTALFNNDATTVKKMLPSIPKEYRTRLAGPISNLLKTGKSYSKQ